MTPLRILVVDDEQPARRRIRQLLEDIADQVTVGLVNEASDGLAALEKLHQSIYDVVLLDIRMPGMDGLQLALHINAMSPKPHIIFLTAFDQYAVRAFELSATDYLLKPVKAERLQTALLKVANATRAKPSIEPPQWQAALVPNGRTHLRSTCWDRVNLIPVGDILYFRAELKYVTAHTLDGEFLIEESLAALEREFSDRLLRIHRNCLVSRQAIAGYIRDDSASADHETQWLLLLRDCSDRLPVSRRQLPQLKQALKE
jgi:two-component system response regulator AlgR